jgi:hypothetical protein
MGSTFTGPVANVGGVAGCTYDGGGNEAYVLFNAPGLSQSQFTSQAKSGLGPTATPVPGVGVAAYASTAYGHAQINVWVSQSQSFSVSITTADAVVQPDNAAQAEAVARAIAAS